MVDVSVRNVTKRFPGVLALDAVSLTFHGGEIHVLLGENGAGKSTLMGLLAGMQQPDAGEIIIEGVPRRIDSPRRSRALGIGAVFQQLLLVPSLTVIENLMLGGAWWRPLRRPAALRRFAELSAALAIRIDPDAPLSALSLGEQQQVEIVRALWREQKLLLLDEPTSMLTPQGVRELGETLRRLKAKGVALVLITHKLLEAFEFGDRISVLRQGRLAGGIEPHRLGAMSAPERTDEVLRLMFGGDVDAITPGAAAEAVSPLRGASGAPRASAATSVSALRAPDRAAPPVLRAIALATAANPGETPLRDVSFDLWAGEVLGVAGVDGNGQKHLAEVLGGQRAASGGRITLAGGDVTRGRVAERSRTGIRYVTDERLGEGTVGGLSVAINLTLKQIGMPPFWRRGITDWNAIHTHAREQIGAHDIRTPSERTPVGKLSGGNIQKVLLARELGEDARVVILNKPTYGLDLQNQRLTQQRIASAARRGVALVVISTDLDELIEVSDRIGVMFQGRLTGIVDNDAAAEAKIGALMTGADGTRPAGSETADASRAGPE